MVLWWCILFDALPIRGLLAKRIQVDEISCPLCGEGEKLMEHLFLHCNFSFHLWRSSPWGVMPIIESGAHVWDWVKFLWNLRSKGVDTDKLFFYASIVVETIWKARNDKVHNNSLGNIQHCIDSISTCYVDYGSFLFALTMAVVSPVWSPPPDDWVKIICDVKVGSCSMCVVTLARDHTGIVMWMITNMLNFSNPLVGEVAACQLALETAVMMKYLFVMIESDSKIVINALKGNCSN
ncbi:uncharacterized protein LOC115713158 [Cannabis sativa]|uniref:uncharacterized protein LOC115713158 n=1 Tax=Cannabis sativa TaxID=3483 RepID=UPI0029CA4D1F|nr:uncharacterized protein LOC115713158 [Cannabis sativa]